VESAESEVRSGEISGELYVKLVERPRRLAKGVEKIDPVPRNDFLGNRRRHFRLNHAENRTHTLTESASNNTVSYHVENQEQEAGSQGPIEAET
jgi:hypothetical protein